MTTESPEQIAGRLMAPASTSSLWNYDQVRLLLLEAAESAPLSAAERREARSALRMIKDAMGELFGPLAAVSDEPAPEYRHQAEQIIAGLQRIADKMAADANPGKPPASP